MTSSNHGDATVTQDVFEGAMAFLIEVDGVEVVSDESGHARLMVSDRQFRDLMLCGGDLAPSMLPMRELARIAGTLGEQVHGYDNGIPVRTIGGQKACGCFITDVCDCYAPPQTWGWS